MTLSRRNPTNEVMTLRDTMERFFEEGSMWGSMTQNDHDTVARGARLAIDAYNTDNEIVVLASVPGVNPDDVEITVEGGDTLTIRGEIPKMEVDDGSTHIFSERFHGPFSRTLQLNVPIEIDKIEATFENGVLTLTLPKAEEVKPKVIKVQAK
jgi:HSP20 family protein